MPRRKKGQKNSPDEKLRNRGILRVDLHGLNSDDALCQVELALDRALRTNCEQLEIIHGIGTGKLKKVVHRYLSDSQHISRFQIDERNPGTTWAFL